MIATSSSSRWFDLSEPSLPQKRPRLFYFIHPRTCTLLDVHRLAVGGMDGHGTGPEGDCEMGYGGCNFWLFR